MCQKMHSLTDKLEMIAEKTVHEMEKIISDPKADMSFLGEMGSFLESVTASAKMMHKISKMKDEVKKEEEKEIFEKMKMKMEKEEMHEMGASSSVSSNIYK